MTKKKIKRTNVMASGKRLMLFLAISIFFCGLSFAVDRYVSLTGTNNYPYTNWPDAATNIQWAIDASTTATDTVWVASGSYGLTNQITVNKANLALRSVNGRNVTIIDANYTSRCMLITANNVFLDGFTLTNGRAADHGAGLNIQLSLTSPSVSNCIITGNSCTADNKNGGGVYMGSGTLRKCTISGNSVAGISGGGIYQAAGIITNCIISNNISTNDGCRGVGISMGSGSIYNSIISGNTGAERRPVGYGYGSGGGIYLVGGSPLVQNCIISNNYAWYFSGGIYVPGLGTVQNCVIISNRSDSYAAGIGLQGFSICRNNLIIKNVCTGGANGSGGIWIYDTDPTVVNCTVAGNSAGATSYGGGVVASSGGSCSNMIIYDNWPSNFGVGTTTGDCSYSCSYPLITTGVNNITNNPLFVDPAINNYHLNNNSPCLNNGINQGWMTGAVDMDGHRRIDRFFRRVDMGAYEYLSQGTMFMFR